MIRGAALALALACVVAVTGPLSAPVAAQTAQTVPAARHTAADVRFMQGMIHHHAQAVAMAALVPARTTREDLRALAARIDVSQVDEMENMRQWLRTRGAPLALPATTVGHEAHGTHASGTPMMPGMLSAGEMDALERSTGAEFERRFLAGMIKHHEGALVMVRELFGTPGAAEETAIFSFASDVDADQRAEIARMRRLLAALSPG
ncbi:MAG: DUF305 domain-containing protein [Gemmatimonadetes bacterium]|nr:DUF305 domain-containing protein [Gemmatimonadota bacterium]